MKKICYFAIIAAVFLLTYDTNAATPSVSGSTTASEAGFAAPNPPEIDIDPVVRQRGSSVTGKGGPAPSCGKWTGAFKTLGPSGSWCACEVWDKKNKKDWVGGAVPYDAQNNCQGSCTSISNQLKANPLFCP